MKNTELMMNMRIIEALENDTIYDFINNNSWNMDKSELVTLLNEVLYNLYDTDEKVYKSVLRFVKAFYQEKLEDLRWK